MMHKVEGSKTVVVGGRSDVPQEYAGVVGGQSADFWAMDTHVKVGTIHTFLSISENAWLLTDCLDHRTEEQLSRASGLVRPPQFVSSNFLLMNR